MRVSPNLLLLPSADVFDHLGRRRRECVCVPRRAGGSEFTMRALEAPRAPSARAPDSDQRLSLCVCSKSRFGSASDSKPLREDPQGTATPPPPLLHTPRGPSHADPSSSSLSGHGGFTRTHMVTLVLFYTPTAAGPPRPDAPASAALSAVLTAPERAESRGTWSNRCM